MSPTFSDGPCTGFSCCAEARGLHSEATISQATSPIHADLFIQPPFEALTQSHDGNAFLRDFRFESIATAEDLIDSGPDFAYANHRHGRSRNRSRPAHVSPDANRS